jgi:hypothetical protein
MSDKEDKKFKCAKCGKEKSEDKGNFIYGGKSFCCKECCGDPKKGDHDKKKNNVCEFC